MPVDDSLEKRLRLTKYSRSACLAAIRGKSIPHALGHPLHQLCVIRGIRYHHGFATELHGVLPVFTRALNARSIMSGIIPDLSSPNSVPYCIWHPETASEDIYRELARKHPQLAYQVGRACAVAGYTKLFNELDILPEVHIAEEARECGNLDIYEFIVSQPVRYSIMNDYELRIDVDSRKPAYLNGDSCVRWMLDIKQKFEDATSDFFEEDGEFFPEDFFDSVGYRETMFNITEDMHIDDDESDGTAKRLSASRPDLRWLYEPLPQDLPTVQKDILIAMAAYYGDVDRYARLRRPKVVYGEMACCTRGIYHNTLFALWWASQSGPKDMHIEKAINARFIMNNVLSRALFKKHETPYLIWWPVPAQPATYRKLASIQPEMLPQIVRACIYANYEDLFTELLPQLEIDTAVFLEADRQNNKFFRKALDDEITRRGVEPQDPTEHWKLLIGGHISDISCNTIVDFLDANSIGSSFDAPYDGWQCDATQVEFMLCLPDAWKKPQDDDGMCVDYVNWPPTDQQGLPLRTAPS